MCVRVSVRSTLMEADDVGVSQGGRDLNLSLDVNPVQVFDDAVLTDRLDGHLTEEMRCGEKTGPELRRKLVLFGIHVFSPTEQQQKKVDGGQAMPLSLVRLLLLPISTEVLVPAKTDSFFNLMTKP